MATLQATTVREYLAEKAETPSEWLRREPRETHPEILALVRETRAAGLFYDDDVERYVNEHVGDLPPHQRHGTVGRDPLVKQLAAEVYVAKCVLTDETNKRDRDAAISDGYVPVDNADLVEGRYMLRRATMYSGQTIATVSDIAEPVTVKRFGEQWGYVPKRKRTGFVLQPHALVKEGWTT